SFSTSCSDTSLWGIYLVSENLMTLDDMAHFTLKEWCLRLMSRSSPPEVSSSRFVTLS
ncbi:hypothetical protein EDD22DRAFT_777162, partial [Suillus occidentalis]